MTRWLRKATCAFVFAGAWSNAAADPIQWRVRERFPLLEADAFDKLEMLAAPPITASALWTKVSTSWVPGTPIVADPLRTLYDHAEGRYRPSYLKRPGDLVDVVFRLADARWAGSRCRWSVQGSHTSETVRAPCAEWATLPVALEVATTASVDVEASGGTSETLVTSVRVRQHVVVAMGDSYASGEGNPDIPATYYGPGSAKPGADWMFDSKNAQSIGAPAVWWDTECHRSLVSWPVMSVLVRALNDFEGRTQYRVLSYACSGAELLNGVFTAQTDPPGGARKLSPSRDGELRLASAEERNRPVTRRSQVNAMYDDLCDRQARGSRLLRVPGRDRVVVEVQPCAEPLRVDEFLLSIGGNDLGFGAMAKGMLVPKDPNEGLMRKPMLQFFRWVMNAGSLDDATESIDAVAAHYTRGLQALLQAGGLREDQTVLVAYPDPVGVTGPSFDADACIAGDTVVSGSPGTRVQAERVRIRDSNLVLSPVLRRLAFGFGDGWTVELSKGEVGTFKGVYEKIARMQAAVNQVGIRVAPYGDPDVVMPARICTRQSDPSTPSIPLHFCANTATECDLCSTLGGQWCPSSVRDWNHYKPSRRVVNFLNDTLLAQRSWTGVDPSRSELVSALAGSMHPTGWAHAQAAHAVSLLLSSSATKSTVAPQPSMAGAGK